MDYAIETAALETLPCDCIIIGVYQNRELIPAGIALTESLKSIIGKMIARGDISGKLGETLLINVIPDSQVQRALLVGLGENKPLSTKNFRKALFAAASNLKRPYLKSIACGLAEVAVEGAGLDWAVRQIVEVFNDSIYQFTALKSEKETESKLQKITITVNQSRVALAQQG